MFKLPLIIAFINLIKLNISIATIKKYLAYPNNSLLGLKINSFEFINRKDKLKIIYELNS